MKLFLTTGWTGEEKLVSNNPTEQELPKLLDSLDWQEFHSIRLEQDSNNWIDVSGNLNQDGLAIVYEEHGTQFISNEAPESISQLEETLRFYFKGDQRFKDFGFSSSEHIPEPNSNKETDYQSWKIRYEAKEKIEKRKHIVAVFGSIIIFGFFSYFFYLWYNDELKFVGYDTDHTIATVTHVKLTYGFKGNLYQLVKYEFDYKGDHFKGYFKGTQITGRHKVGDRVKIKFAIDKPSISKRVATMVKKY